MTAEGAFGRISVTVCGDGGCGKSSITLRLVRSQFITDYDPTIEDSYSVTRNIDGCSYHLALTDTAGQEEYRGLWASSNLHSDAFLLVYDITKRSTLEGLSWFINMIEVEADNRVDQNNKLLRERGTRVRGKIDQGWRSPPVLIVVGNKCDLSHLRQLPSKAGWDYAKGRGCGFMETSAKNMINVEETFAWIVRKVVQERTGSESRAPLTYHPYPSRQNIAHMVPQPQPPQYLDYPLPPRSPPPQQKLPPTPQVRPARASPNLPSRRSNPRRSQGQSSSKSNSKSNSQVLHGLPKQRSLPAEPEDEKSISDTRLTPRRKAPAKGLNCFCRVD